MKERIAWLLIMIILQGLIMPLPAMGGGMEGKANRNIEFVVGSNSDWEDSLDGEVYNDLKQESWFESVELYATATNAQAMFVNEVDEVFESPVFVLDDAGAAFLVGQYTRNLLFSYDNIMWPDGAECYEDQLELVEDELGVTGLKSIYQILESNQGAMTFDLGEVASFESAQAYNSAEVQTALQEIYEQYRPIIQTAMDAYIYDHPEIFWRDSVQFRYSIRMTNNEDFTGFIYRVSCSAEFISSLSTAEIASMTQEQEEAIENITVKILEDWQEYEQALYIHNTIANTVNYDYSLQEDYAHEGYGALVGSEHGKKKLVVCEGYAKAFKILCNRIGIPCVLVVGQGGTTESKEGHMWNYIKLEDGQWYAVDVTWDDQMAGIRYDYFLSGSETIGFRNTSFMESHIEEHSFSMGGWQFAYPVIAEERYNTSGSIEELTLKEKRVDLIKGETRQLTIEVKPTDAQAPVFWESSDENVASVTRTGEITALKSGTAYIFVKSITGLEDFCQVFVTTPVSGITLKQTTAEIIGREKTIQLDALIEPLDADNQNLNWKSEAEDIASVDSAGMVTGHIPGTANLIVSTEDGRWEAVCKITVSLSREDLIHDFVVRVYKSILKREPDEEGLETWGHRLLGGSVDGATLIERFVSSQEFMNMQVDDTDFVELMYQTLFDRTADESGKKAQLGYLSNGVSKKFILKRMIDSNEFIKICEKFGIVRGSISVTENRDQNYKMTLFVSNAYKILLNRTADVDGLNEWTGVLLSGKMGGAELINRFMTSKEYTNQGYDDHANVDNLYRSMMGREADNRGRENWVSILDDGVSISYLVKRFAVSTEFKNICKRYGIETGEIRLTESRDQNLKITQFVSRCYVEALERKPDISGLNNWTKRLLAKSMTPERVAEYFVFSNEVKNRKLNDVDFVSMLYRVCMGRKPDVEGLDAWVRRLQHGKSRNEVFQAFSGSKEFKAIISQYGF